MYLTERLSSEHSERILKRSTQTLLSTSCFFVQHSGGVSDERWATLLPYKHLAIINDSVNVQLHHTEAEGLRSKHQASRQQNVIRVIILQLVNSFLLVQRESLITMPSEEGGAAIDNIDNEHNGAAE